MQTNDFELPEDSVEMVRAIRQKSYEETKGMTREEFREYHHKKFMKCEEYRKQFLEREKEKSLNR
ncbi:MAG: hypothetical protein LBQ50_14120 [Planctomycetaceae bacterium]|jgi:hypothetical protein|nr:hypothetical protein [Planctomycetaceae bacterium]